MRLAYVTTLRQPVRGNDVLGLPVSSGGLLDPP